MDSLHLIPSVFLQLEEKLHLCPLYDNKQCDSILHLYLMDTLFVEASIVLLMLLLFSNTEGLHYVYRH